MELISFLVILVSLYFFGEWAVRKYDESKRSRHAIRTESTRVKNNRRLTKTDCYVYLIKRERFIGKPFASTYLKIGIGVEDRVRIQLKEEGTTLISLYAFRIRDDAFKIEQRILKAWNNKVLGEITTHNRSLGTEYIHFSEKDLKKALKILSESLGQNVIADNLFNDSPQEVEAKSNNQHPPVLDRTLVYLLLNKREKLIKVGMGTFDRPDALKGNNWEIIRFCHFTNRESAKFAEAKVLSYWRNDLGMPIPDRAKSLLKSGHTETVESSVGIYKAWEIISTSPNFIPPVSQTEEEILAEFRGFLERGNSIWNDQAFWIHIQYSWYGSIQDKIYQLSNTVNTLQHIRADSKAAKSELRAFARDFQTFMNQNHATLDRAGALKRWEEVTESEKRPFEQKISQQPKKVNSKIAEGDEVSRFWEKVEKSDNCWQWTGAKNPAGYGLAVFEDRVQPAHRVCWKIEFGECAPEAILDNKCGNRSCVKTEHWELSVKRRSNPGEIRISPFVCTTPHCGKPSVTMLNAGLCDSCRQRAKRERRKLREEATKPNNQEN
ncbi:MAG: hypothetical protein O3C26_04265 [Actinomycetota bacterium]|nr:hypothetical protein [Actinomycetota bacterium]